MIIVVGAHAYAVISRQLPNRVSSKHNVFVPKHVLVDLVGVLFDINGVSVLVGCQIVRRDTSVNSSAVRVVLSGWYVWWQRNVRVSCLVDRTFAVNDSSGTGRSQLNRS